MCVCLFAFAFTFADFFFPFTLSSSSSHHQQSEIIIVADVTRFIRSSLLLHRLTHINKFYSLSLSFSFHMIDGRHTFTTFIFIDKLSLGHFQSHTINKMEIFAETPPRHVIVFILHNILNRKSHKINMDSKFHN